MWSYMFRSVVRISVESGSGLSVCPGSCVGASRLLYPAVISDCKVLAKQKSVPVPLDYRSTVSPAPAPLGYLQMSRYVNVYIAFITVVFFLYTTKVMKLKATENLKNKSSFL